MFFFFFLFFALTRREMPAPASIAQPKKKQEEGKRGLIRSGPIHRDAMLARPGSNLRV